MSNPLHDLMYRGESGAAGYNAFNRGTYVDSNGRERIRPGQPPMDFSELTVGELQDLQGLPRDDPRRVFAVGKYQIIPSTMDAAVARLGLERDAEFTPAVQDRIFTDYLLREKQPAVRDYITSVSGATLHQAQRGLAREWASFGDPGKGGSSYYGGANRAHITLEDSGRALEALRQAYSAARAHGMSPEGAWRQATGVGADTRQDNLPNRVEPGGGSVPGARRPELLPLFEAAKSGPGAFHDALQCLRQSSVGIDFQARAAVLGGQPGEVAHCPSAQPPQALIRE